MSKIVKRVIVSFILIVMGTGIALGNLWESKNPPIEEEYKQALDAYIPVPSRSSIDALRKAAYEVEVSEDDLEEIRPNLYEDVPYHYTTYENMRLIHFYSVILNRYEPNPMYRDTVLLTEYVFDGLLEREQLHNDHRLTERIYIELLSTIAKMDETQRDEAIERVAGDFLEFADAEVQAAVYDWQNIEYTYEVAPEYLEVQQKFFDAIN